MKYQYGNLWDRYGTNLEECSTIPQALALAGFDKWNLALEEIYLRDNRVIHNARAVVRETDRQDLGIVSPHYSIIQNEEHFGIFEGAMQDHGMTLSRAGSLENGRMPWMLFKLPQVASPFPDDRVEGFGLAITSHNGKIQGEFRPKPIRVASQTTLSMHKGKLFSIPHCGDVKSKIAGVTALVEDAMVKLEETGKTYRKMAETVIDNDHVETILMLVFDGKETKAIEERKEDIRYLLRTCDSDQVLARTLTKGELNYWALFVAICDHVDHARKKNSKAEAPNLSALFGSGQKLKDTALTIIMEML